MTITRSQFAALLEPGLEQLWLDVFSVTEEPPLTTAIRQALAIRRAEKKRAAQAL